MNGKIISVNRTEHKYFITPSQTVTLSDKLSKILHKDINNADTGYIVKSLYFDTVDNKDFYGKADGIFFHEKVRLRVYGKDYSSIKLENKRKYGDKQIKDTLTLDRIQAQKLCQGDFSFLLDMNTELSLNFYRLFSKGYRPVCIVQYVREAYTWPEKNIRITLDKNPVYSEINLDLFDDEIRFANVFDINTTILEVKCNGKLPGFIKDVLGTAGATRISASKYASSRKFLDDII